MASSTLSLDSLSSPSPSPSPPPPPAKATQLDPDSELSELTDDDQDASDAVDKRVPSSAKEDHNNIHPIPSTSTSKASRRGTHQRSSSRRGGAVGRKKRSSIVPAPMWGWAENKTASTSSAAAPVEEEEEEMSGPPRAMEEEEEEEAGEAEDEEPEDGDFGVNEDVEPGRGYGPQRRIGPYISQRYNGISYPPPPSRHWVQQRPRRARKGWRQPDEEPKEDDQEEAPDHKADDPHDTNNKNPTTRINGGGDDDDEGSASGSPYPSTSRKKRSTTKQRAPPSSSSSAALRKRKESGGDDHYSGSERPVHPSKKKKNDNKVQHDEDEEVSDVPALATPAPPVPPPQAASDNENTESEEEPFVLPPMVASPPAAKPISPITTIIAMNNNTAAAMSALTALAAAADSIDIMDTIPHLKPTSTSPTTTSIIPGFGSGSVKSLEASAALLTSAALTTGAISSRSPSPAVKSDAEASSAEDEPRPTRSKARNGKSAMKGKGGNVKNKAGDKHTGAIVNGAEASTSITTNVTTRKGPPPPLNLKIDTQLDEPPDLPVVDTTVEDDVNDRSLDDREDVDMDDLEEDEEEEEEEEEEADEPEEEQVDEEANEVDEEVVDPEGDDDDQEQDGADNENDNENEDMEEGENGDENENDEEPSPDGDADGDEHEESDLQPAHRAEALDVLATIELKFALLRERLYVEKMEGLAWEERMIQASAHPEMQHLQKELTKRRDKRLELASRKRSYEVANASKRRRADEDGVWSWWKFARDELQTDMISETNRKRRRLERERRAIERPQPIRRIPLPVPLDIHNPPPLPPTLRKIVKSYPFGTRKQNKLEGNSHHHNHHSQYPKAHYVYPEISTLSAVDIANDLEFLVQNRRMGMGMGASVASGVYEVQQQQHSQHQMQQQQHYGSQQQQLYNSHQQHPVPQRNGAVLGMGMGGGIGRTVSNVGMGMSNGVLPLQVQSQVQQQQQQASQMGPPPPNNSMMHPHPHQPPLQHPVSAGYEPQYVGDMPQFGPSGVGGRMREPQPMNMNSYQQQQQQHGLPPLGPPPPPPSQPTTTTKSRYASYPYPGDPVSGSGGRMHQSSHGPPLPMSGNSAHSHGHGYGKDHEKSQGPGGPSPGPSNNGPAGHHHPTSYFGQGGPTSSSSHMPGVGMNGRRSISPVHVMSNGGGGKPNGMWMSGYHPGNGGGKGGGGEWGDARMMHDDEEREMLVREREREREREQDRDREIERERARYRDRDRDREHQELERERQRDYQHIQPQHRQPPPSHLHSGSGAPPPQGPGVVPHHHVVPSHHHHRPPPHHHHVVHHHHGQGQSHTSTSLPPGSVGSAPIVHSPRSTRDYDSSRPPPQLHPGSGQPHSSEVIILSSGSRSSSQPQLHPRDRERESWSGKGPDEHHNPGSSSLEYRERDLMIREMDNRKLHSRRPSSGPPMLPLEERDRPMAMPFVLPPSHPMQQASTPSSHLGSSSVTGSGTSPRGAPPSWTTSSSYDDAPRIPSTSSAPGYMNSPHTHDTHVRSPIQGHRYAPPSSTGSGMGRHITTGSSSSSSSALPPPSRARPPPSPSYSNSLSKSHRSPATSPRIRPLSPPAPGNPSSKLLSALPTGSRYSSSPRLSGPGRTSTPTGHHPSSIPSNQNDVITKNGTQQPSSSSSSSYPINSRNTSPLMSSLHAPLSSSASRLPPGSSGLDRDRERHSTAMGLSPRLGGSSSHPPPPFSKMSTAQTVDGH